MKRFQGIFPALLTPFDKNGKVYYPALEKLVEMNLEESMIYVLL